MRVWEVGLSKGYEWISGVRVGREDGQKERWIRGQSVGSLVEGKPHLPTNDARKRDQLFDN